MGVLSRDSRTAGASRFGSGVVGLGTALVFGFLAWPLVAGEVYTASDLGNFYLPIRDFYRKALLAHQDFIWFPNQFTGFYLHGEGQAGLLHPLNLAQYRWLPLEAAFQLELLRGYAVLFAGAFVLLRRLSLPRDASLFGAFLATFSSFTLLHYMHLNIVVAAGHLPWLLLSMLAMLRPRKPLGRVLGVAGIVLLTASLCMLGHPQVVWMVTAVEGFALACALSGLALNGDAARPELLSAAARFGAAKALGFAAAGVALLPVAESLSASFRAVPPEGFTSDFNVTPLALVQLVAPYLLAGRAPHENLTEYGLYLGAIPTVLVVYALVRGSSHVHARLVRSALVLAGLALWLGLGDWGGLYRLQSALPVIGLFRAPARYVLVVELAVAFVAALAFVDAARRSGSEGRLSFAGGAALFAPCVIGVAVVASSSLFEAPLAESALLRAAGPVLLGLAALGVLAAARGVRFALPALAVLAMADVGAYGLSFVARGSAQTPEAFVGRYPVPERPSAGRLHWGPPALTMKGFRLAGGYVAMTPDRVLDLGAFGEPLRGLDVRLANALRVSEVRWAIGTRVPEPLPRARLLTVAKVSLDPNLDIGEVDVSTTALVYEPVALDGGSPGRVEIAVDAPGAVELLSNASGRQLLVVSERHHPGWRAKVDGVPTPVLRAYGDYLACVVGPGRQRVTLSFAPSSLRDGAWLSAAALLLTALWLAGGAARAWRAPRERG